jgi:hypothetical protein
MALFSTQYLLASDATAGVKSAKMPIGDLFASARAPYSLATFPVPPFINVNTLNDFLAAQLMLMAECASLTPSVRHLATRMRRLLQHEGELYHDHQQP